MRPDRAVACRDEHRRWIVVREFPLKTGYADYRLFIDRREIGAIEAKAEGMDLTANLAQAEPLRQSILKRAFEGRLV
jgi:type I site-specific restriction endonuclease